MTAFGTLSPSLIRRIDLIAPIFEVVKLCAQFMCLIHVANSTAEIKRHKHSVFPNLNVALNNQLNGLSLPHEFWHNQMLLLQH